MKKRAMIATGTFVSALVLAGCQQEAKAPEPVRPVMSMVLEPSRTDGAVAVGVVEPQYKTNLAFRVLGRLTARPVSIGDLVSEGQTVGVIDSTALELASRAFVMDTGRITRSGRSADLKNDPAIREAYLGSL